MRGVRVIEHGDMREIVLPEAKPAYEWIFGRAVQKVSPKRNHALLQGAFCSALGAWAEGRGEVGTEWRFRLTPPGEETRPLVPDVAYISYARLAGLSVEEKQEPRMAPDVAVEIRAPDDRQRYIDEKTRVYLSDGCTVVILVDPQTRTVHATGEDGARTYSERDTFEYPALPGFTLPLAPFFARIQ